MIKGVYAICLVLLILALIPVPGSCDSNNESDLKQIFYLNSYDYGFSWSKLIADGVYDGINEVETDVQVHTEFMDSKFVYDEKHFENLYNLYSYKFRNTRPDVIIVSDDNALRFINQYRDDLFPGVPVVFTGINDYEEIISNRPEGYTGIIEKLPIDENIEYILQLHPGFNTLYVVTDDTYSGEALRRQTDEIAEKYAGRLEVRYPAPGLNADEMISDLSSLPENSAVLILTYNAKDITGDSYYTDYYAYALSQQDLVPVYTVQDQYNDLGITGGYETSAYELGRMAAEKALMIIDGTDPDSIPVEMLPPYIKTLNYEHIGMYGIEEGNIPEDTTIFNVPPSTITIPRDYATIGVILLFSLVAILVTSLIYNSRLKTAETELKRSLDEKNILLRELHHRVKNNLSIISSMIAMQVINSKEKETKQKLNEASNRIISMSIVHDNMYTSEDISKIKVHDIFVSLGERLIQNYSIGFIIDFEVNGDECLISPDQAIPVSLVLNEIISNSLKFAFEGRTSGRIAIDYRCSESFFEMIVSDNGCGIPESVLNNEADSMGLDLIENITTMQLNGSAEVKNESGTKWIISFPLSNCC